MKPTLKLLAFDLGSSNGKTFLGSFDGSRLSLELIERFANGPISIRDELFWNVPGIYDRLANGIRWAIRNHYPIVSVGLDSFSNDFGLLDSNGHYVTQMHCYRDERTKRNENKIYERIPRKKLHALSGNQNALFGTVMQLISMRLEDQGYLLDGSGKLLFLPDLLIYFLTGKIQAEYTIASVSQMMDFSTGNWSQEILAVCDVPERIMPPITPTGSKLGRITAIPECNSIEVISVCEHDTASAFLAAPLGAESIIISSGTWSLVGLETDKPIINEETYRHNVANEGGYPGHHRLLKNVMGLWIIQQCILEYSEQGEEHSVEELMAMAEAEVPFRYLINPDDERFFSPGAMLRKIANYCQEHGQGYPTSPGQVIRCVVESLAMQYRCVIEELEAISYKKFSTINVVGGGSNNRFLNQCVASATGRRVIAGPADATVLGNMIVQLIALGELTSVEQGRILIKNSFPMQIYEPMNVPAWEVRYQEYVNSYTFQE